MFYKTSKTNDTAASAPASSARKSVPSVISSDLHILGNLVSDAAIDIDGSVEGNIRSEQVTVRPNGKIKGDIIAQSVHIYGEVHGLVRAQSVHLYSSCRIEGIVMHHTLTVEDGAFIDGKFKRLQDKNSATSSSDSALSMFDDEDSESPLLANNLRLIG